MRAYKQNTQLMKINKALKIYDAKIDEARSAYKPNIALFGAVEKIDNNYDGGMSNSQNDSSWSVGIGAEWNLFNGYKTTNEVSEAKLNKLKILEQKKFLEQALALQVKKAYIGVQSSTDQVDILKQTVKTAEDNRDLNTRAYQADMVKTKDVVEAQITEAQIKAKYFQISYSKVLNKAALDLATGTVD
jgi:outer membrane protein TolC